MAGAMFVSCDDDFTRPPVIYPPTDNTTTNYTIEQVRDRYWPTVSATPKIIATSAATGDSMVFAGRVCSSDQTGNISRMIVVQSTDEAGNQVAVAFSVQNYSMYPLFPFGQEVTVKATGLSIGGYRGLLQFGSISGNEMTFMDADMLATHMVRRGIGLPEPAKVDTTVMSLEHIAQYKSDNDSVKMWQSRLIRVDGVTFEDAGSQYAPGTAAVNRYVKDANGNRLNVRCNNRSTWSEDTIPYGTGAVVGILSYYTPDFQLLMIDADGAIGFDNIAPEPEPVDDTKIVQDFNGSTKIPEGWSIYKLKGDKDWYVRDFNGNNYATVSGYKGTAPFDAWLVSPGLDMAKAQEKVLSFETQVNGYGATTSDFKVYALNNPDPAKATVKTELTVALPTAPASGYSSWVSSGEIDMSAFSGVVYIGFDYTATQDANYATWCVDNFAFGCKAQTSPDTPEPPAPAGNAIFTGLSDKLTQMPTDWVIENISLSEGLSKVWSWGTYNDLGYLKASAYIGSTAYAAESYAISPVIDLTGATGCQASFEHAARFQTTLRTLCGLCVREEGATAWTPLTITTWPEAGAWNYATCSGISLADFDGKKIQLAFKYGSSAAGADTWQIRNLTVTGNK